MIDGAESFIRHALSIGAFEFRPESYLLNSGRISPYFFNSARFDTGESLYVLSSPYAQIAKSQRAEVVYGPIYKGASLAVAVSVVAHTKHGLKIGWAYNRKVPKDHAEGGLIVGASLSGHRVLIVDDVMSTGKSSDEAVDTIRLEGGIVVGFAIAFDREERKSEDGELSALQEFQAKYLIPVFSIATLTDLISVLQADQSPRALDILPKLRAYQEQYGAK